MQADLQTKCWVRFLVKQCRLPQKLSFMRFVLIICNVINLSSFRYAGLLALPPGLVGQVNKHNPHVMELELSRYGQSPMFSENAYSFYGILIMACSLSCSNKLSDLPDELAELQHLRVLRVKYNMLTKLPEVLVKMSKLEVLELSGNQITTVDDRVLAGLINVRYS